jgi:hypothetical protein
MYSVEVTNAAGCSVMSAEIQYSVLGAPNAVNGIFTTYPNPSTGSFTLQLGSVKASTVMISIIDLNGRNVYKQKATAVEGRTEIDTNLKGGVYILVMESDDVIQRQKLVIE